MDNIIIFEKPEEKPIEDIFIESLTEEQSEMFFVIISKIIEDYKVLMLKNEALKGGSNET